MLMGLLPVGIFLFLALGGDASSEEQVTEAIGRVATAIEEGKLGDALEPISESYSDENGITKKALRGMLFQQFTKRGPIDLTLSGIAVEVNGDEAKASFDVLAMEGRKGSALPLPADGDLLHFEVELRREAKEWRILSHRRTKALGPDAPD